jgi:hypothetical protein
LEEEQEAVAAQPVIMELEGAEVVEWLKLYFLQMCYLILYIYNLELVEMEVEELRVNLGLVEPAEEEVLFR